MTEPHVTDAAGVTARRQKIALAIWLILLCVSAWIVLAHTKIHTDLTGFLPKSPDRTQQLLMNQLRKGPASRLVLIGIEGDTPERLAAISHAFAAALRKDRQIAFVQNGELDGLAAERDVLMRYRYLLSPAVTPEHFSTPQLKLALQASAQLLASEGGALAKPLIPADPTGEVARVFALWTPAHDVHVRDGVWFAADEHRALLIAQTQASGMDATRQQDALIAIRQHFQHALQATRAAAHSGPDAAQLVLSGTGVFAAESRQTIEQDSWRLSLIATVLVAAVLLIVYRSIGLSLLAFLPVASGMLVGVAAVSVAFGGVHGITLAFGATLIGEAVDYPNYAFLNTARGAALKQALARIGPTLWLAILTTVFSSMAMLLSSFSGLAQLGMLSLVAVAVAGLTTQFVLPVFAGAALTARKMERLPFVLTPGNRWRRAVLPLLALSIAVLWLQRDRIWDDDLANLSPVSAQAKQRDQDLRTQLGAPDVRHVLMVTGRDREQALQNSEALRAEFAQLVTQGVIGGYDMAANYLPSQALQAQRRAALPAESDLQGALRLAMAGLPFRDGAFQPFLRDVAESRQRPFLKMDDLRDSSIGLKVQSMLIDDKQGAVALVTLTDVRDAARLRLAAAQLAGKGVIGIDLKADTGRLINRYRGEALRLSFLGFCMITLLLFWTLGSVGATRDVLVPVIAGTVMCATTLVLLGEKLTLFHLVAMLLVIGVGLNYALFFNRHEANQPDTQRNHLALIVCSMTTFLSFGVLTLSSLPVLHAIGATVASGSLLCLLCAYLLAKPANAEET